MIRSTEEKVMKKATAINLQQFLREYDPSRDEDVGRMCDSEMTSHYRVSVRSDCLADDAVLGEPLSGILAILAGKRGFLKEL